MDGGGRLTIFGLVVPTADQWSAALELVHRWRCSPPQGPRDFVAAVWLGEPAGAAAVWQSLEPLWVPQTEPPARWRWDVDDGTAQLVAWARAAPCDQLILVVATRDVLSLLLSQWLSCDVRLTSASVSVWEVTPHGPLVVRALGESPVRLTGGAVWLDPPPAHSSP